MLLYKLTLSITIVTLLTFLSISLKLLYDGKLRSLKLWALGLAGGSFRVC